MRGGRRIGDVLLVLLLSGAGACGGTPASPGSLSAPPGADLAAVGLPEATSVPAEARADWIRNQQRSADASYGFRRAEGAATVAPCLVADLPRSGLHTQIDATGAVALTRDAGTRGTFGSGDFSVGLELTGWGLGEADLSIPAVEARTSAHNEVTLVRGPALEEWYTSGPLGLEQGFVVHALPEGTGETLVLSMQVDGARPAPTSSEREIAFLRANTPSSSPVLARYGESFATDATGEMLPTRLVVHDATLELHVEVGAAQVPINIDPIIWIEQQELIPASPTAGSQAGFRVALDGDTAVVGAWLDEQNGTGAGAAHVFTRSTNVWSPPQKLMTGVPSINDHFGYSVAVHGDVLVAGANQDSVFGTYSGSAYVFTRDGNGGWSERQKLTQSVGATGDNFGSGVAAGQGVIVVGAPGHDAAATGGAAFVFTQSGTNWVEQQTLTASDAASGWSFGASLALDAQTLVAAATGADGGKGAAYVFTTNGSTWTEQAKLSAIDLVSGQNLGTSVTVHGNTAVLGTYSPGAAYVFVRSGTSWQQQQKLQPAVTAQSFGDAVAVSGDTALVGAQFSDDGATNSGAFFVFTRLGTSWTEDERIYRSGSIQLGSSVALQNNTAVVGARTAYGTGRAYVYIRGMDADSDGFVSVAEGGKDCDDSDFGIKPGVVDAQCDGVDDDCDGTTDEDYTPIPTTCGTGACSATGAASCVGGATLDSCTPGVPVANDSTCDGIDDDCDSVDDENYISTTTTCGMGACAASGSTSCVGGTVLDDCMPGLPFYVTDSLCNGIDDDCSGVTDEDYVSTLTACGVGACASFGSTSCVAGATVDSCTPGSPISAMDTTCDGVDDDCSGVADEDYVSIQTACGTGPCSATGSTSCVAGSVVNGCTPGSPISVTDTTCDGVDDDCSGLEDEEYPSAPTTCGVGACASTGNTSCVAGGVVDSCSPAAPAVDDATCDGVDNDCDGTKDEDYVPTATTCGTGPCSAAGATSCVAGSVVDDCMPGGALSAVDTTCDGVDDDCDRANDDDFVAVASACGTGACSAIGQSACVAGGVVDTCTPGAALSDADVTCDGIDDDCDGTTDDDVDCSSDGAAGAGGGPASTADAGGEPDGPASTADAGGAGPEGMSPGDAGARPDPEPSIDAGAEGPADPGTNESRDAATGAGDAAPRSGDTGGCSCMSAGRRASHSAPALLALLALLSVSLHMRRRKRVGA